jgi:hypothetical protein
MGKMYWNCLGTFDVVGKRDGDETGDVVAWKDRYWELNEDNYEAERVGRWVGGGWYDRGEGKRERNSDTDGGGDESDSGEEEGDSDEDEDSDEAY